MNEEQFLKLQEKEKYLTMASKGNYLVGLCSHDEHFFVDIYNEVFNKKERYTQCPKCNYNIVKKLGDEYFKYEPTHIEIMKALEEKAKENNEEFIEVETADGTATIANSTPYYDEDGNEYRRKEIQAHEGQNMHEVKNKTGRPKKK